MKRLNTLFVPTSTYAITRITGITALMMFVIWAGNVMAGIQHYQAPLEQTHWEASSKKLHCSLSHDIPLYGSATFSQSAGDTLQFTMKVKRRATRNRDRAHLQVLPPQWKHQVEAVDLEEVAVHKGDTPFQLEGNLPSRMLTELEKGMFPTFSYRDWIDASDQVTVALPGVHIKDALDTFIQCLASLPAYKFTDFKDSMLHFEFGKHRLGSTARKRLDDVVRFLKDDNEVKRIEVTGHTDNIGRKRNNDKLGERRSQAVRDYLASKGVSVNMFKVKSFGERKPVESNKTNKGRATNRRALVSLVK